MEESFFSGSGGGGHRFFLFSPSVFFCFERRRVFEAVKLDRVGEGAKWSRRHVIGGRGPAGAAVAARGDSQLASIGRRATAAVSRRPPSQLSARPSDRCVCVCRSRPTFDFDSLAATCVDRF